MSDLLQGVDAIIFDFGNVLIDLDYPRVIREFSEVASKNQHEIEELVVTAPILQRFERGMSILLELTSRVQFYNDLNAGCLLQQNLEKRSMDFWERSFLKPNLIRSGTAC